MGVQWMLARIISDDDGGSDDGGDDDHGNLGMWRWE